VVCWFIALSKLNNIGITYNGLTKKTAIDFQNGSYKYIAYMNIFSNSKINTLISDFVQIQLYVIPILFNLTISQSSLNSLKRVFAVRSCCIKPFLSCCFFSIKVVGLTKKTAIDFQNGSYKYIAYMNIFSNSKINTLISDFVQIQLNENQNKVQYGDIFFTTSSETPEEVGMSSVLLEDIENTYLNSFCFAYRLNNFDTLLPEFAQFYFRSFFVRYEILRLAQGSTRFNISKKEVLKIKILLPSVREQQIHIAFYFDFHLVEFAQNQKIKY
jgi:hypothetical protein